MTLGEVGQKFWKFCGSHLCIPPWSFGPLVFVAFLANLAAVAAAAGAMRLFGRLVYDIAVPGAVEEEWMGGRRPGAGGEWPLTRRRREEDEATKGKERD